MYGARACSSLYCPANCRRSARVAETRQGAYRRRPAARLGDLSVNIFPVSNLEDCYLMSPIINEINDPVLSLSYAVAIRVTGKFFRSRGPGICGDRLYMLNDALTVCFCTYCLDFLCGRGFDQKSIFGHAVSGPGRKCRKKGSCRPFSRRTLQSLRHRQKGRPSQRH